MLGADSYKRMHKECILTSGTTLQTLRHTCQQSWEYQRIVSLHAAQTADESALQVELYYRFLKAQARGFDGAFDEFVREEVAQPIVDSMPVEEEEEEEV